MFDAASAIITPLPTVAGWPSKGTAIESAGPSGVTFQAMNFSVSIMRRAPISPSSSS